MTKVSWSVGGSVGWSVGWLVSRLMNCCWCSCCSVPVSVVVLGEDNDVFQ